MTAGVFVVVVSLLVYSGCSVHHDEMATPADPSITALTITAKRMTATEKTAYDHSLELQTTRPSAAK